MAACFVVETEGAAQPGRRLQLLNPLRTLSLHDPYVALKYPTPKPCCDHLGRYFRPTLKHKICVGSARPFVKACFLKHISSKPQTCTQLLTEHVPKLHTSVQGGPTKLFLISLLANRGRSPFGSHFYSVCILNSLKHTFSYWCLRASGGVNARKLLGRGFERDYLGLGV